VNIQIVVRDSGTRRHRRSIAHLLLPVCLYRRPRYVTYPCPFSVFWPWLWLLADLTECYKSGVTNLVPADIRSPARTMQGARGPVLKMTLAWSMPSH